MEAISPWLDDDDLWEDDEWDDNDLVKIDAHVRTKLAKFHDWYLIQMRHFNARQMREVEEWCSDCLEGDWQTVGWDSGCSTYVGVVVRHKHEAVLFRLRWL